MRYTEKLKAHEATHGGNIVRWSAFVRHDATLFNCSYCGHNRIVSKRNIKAPKYGKAAK